MAAKAERARTTLQRSGGFAGVVLRSTVDTDDLDPAERVNYLELLDGLDLAELAKGAKQPAPQQPDRFHYDLSVELDGQHFALQYGEHDLPTQLKPLTQLLVERARKGA
jgi:hypothetical protein